MAWDHRYTALEAFLDLRRAVAGLDERERGVLHLRFIDDLSQQEIAELLQISQSYVSRIIRGALAKLRSNMDAGRPADHRAAKVSPHDLAGQVA